MRRLVIFGSILMGVIGVAILSPAFPEIKRGLNLTDIEVAMLITVFTLPGIFLSPVMGLLADRFNRKAVLSSLLILFGFSGFLCGFVDYKTMLILRFLQGIGGSALTSLSVTLIGDYYRGLDRVKMLGYNASVISVGLAVYPLLGGFLAELNWRYPFYVFIASIPIGLMALNLKTQPRGGGDLTEYFKRTTRTLINRNVILGFISGCVVFVITYGSFLLYVPFILESKFNATPFLRGAILSTTLLITASVSSRLGFLVKRFGLFGTMRFGFLSYALSLFLIPLAPSLFYFTLSVMIFGFGHGTVLPALQSFVIDRAGEENRAIVMTSYNSMIRIGQTVGPIFASALSTHSIELVFVVFSIVSVFLGFLLWNSSKSFSQNPL